MTKITGLAIAIGLTGMGIALEATPAKAELTTCWSTTRRSTKELKPFPCHVIFRGNAVFHIYVGRDKIEDRKIILSIDLKNGIAKAQFNDGSTRRFKAGLDEDMDFRLSGRGNYQMAFSLPSKIKERVKARLESSDDDTPSPTTTTRRRTLSDTPFRF